MVWMVLDGFGWFRIKVQTIICMSALLAFSLVRKHTNMFACAKRC